MSFDHQDSPLRFFLAQLSPTHRGSWAMLLSMAFFVSNDTCTKLLNAQMPLGQMIFLRGLFASAVVAAVCLLTLKTPSWRSMAQPLVIGRGILEVFLTFAFLTALSFLPLPEAIALMQSTPLMIMVLGFIFLKERVSAMAATMLMVGFLGVILVIQPSFETFQSASFIALFAAFLVAVRDMLTRGLAASLPSPVIALATTLIVTLSGLLGLFFEDWVMPNPQHMGLLALAGVFISLANWLITIAMRTGDLNVVGPLRYSIVVWSLILGLVIFGHTPNTLALLGTALIVVSGLFTLKHHRRKAHADAAHDEA
jgi:drug/metabolite transporter (DMT)-like permease